MRLDVTEPDLSTRDSRRQSMQIADSSLHFVASWCGNPTSLSQS
jgi:hypothetical protein